MRKYILGIIFIGIVTVIYFFFISRDDRDVGQVMHVITADMKHERTISWKTATLGELGNLEIRPWQSANITTMDAEAVELPSYNGGKPFMLYTAHTNNLIPGTKYEYRISVGKRQSPWKEFTTEPERAPFKALIFGDSQSADYSEWAKTTEIAWKNNGDAAFFINMGDLVDNGQDEGQWKAWFDGARNLFATIPIAPVMGNHETYNLKWKMAIPNYYLSLFSLPANGLGELEKYNYSYDYGDVHFVVLNTQQNELQEWYPNLLEKQKKWLEKDLAQTQKPWKIVLMHRGIWEHPFNGPLDVIGQTFVPLFDTYHVDLVFTGHVHSYARTKALKKGKSDPSGTIYITTGRSGDRVWEKSPQKPMDEYYYNPLDQPNYLVLEASHDALKVTAVKQNGELIDRTEIKKSQ